MPRSCRWRFAVILRCATLFVAAAMTLLGVDSHYVYIWYPRHSDVPSDATSPDHIILQTLLQLVAVRQYTVKVDDNLDFIIRKLFLVSSIQKTAYAIYLN